MLQKTEAAATVQKKNPNKICAIKQKKEESKRAEDGRKCRHLEDAIPWTSRE